MKQEMMGWQWHQLDHVQIICTLHLTPDKSTPAPQRSVFKGWILFLTSNHQRQSTEGNIAASKCVNT